MAPLGPGRGRWLVVCLVVSVPLVYLAMAYFRTPMPLKLPLLRHAMPQIPEIRYTWAEAGYGSEAEYCGSMPGMPRDCLSHLTGLVYINLPNSAARNASMVRLLSSLGVWAPQRHRWKASTPSDATAAALQSALAARGYGLGAGAAGCWASHVAVMRAFVSLTRPAPVLPSAWLLVLEDDIGLRQDVDAAKALPLINAMLAALPADIDMVWIMSRNEPHLLSVSPDVVWTLEDISMRYGERIEAAVSFSTSAIAYRKSFAAAYLASQWPVSAPLLEFDAAIDNELKALATARGSGAVLTTETQRHLHYGLFKQQLGKFPSEIEREGRYQAGDAAALVILLDRVRRATQPFAFPL